MVKNLGEKLRAAQSAPTQSGADQAPVLKTNPEVQAKIDAFVKQNPDYMNYLKALPRDRLENIAVLRKIDQVENKERIRNSTAQKLEGWLKQQPSEVVQGIADRVAKVAPEKQAGARVNIIRSAIQQSALKASQSVSGGGQRM